MERERERDYYKNNTITVFFIVWKGRSDKLEGALDSFLFVLFMFLFSFLLILCKVSWDDLIILHLWLQV